MTQAGGEPAAAGTGPRQVLERGRPLSQSLLWWLQRRYFEREGIEAWRQGVVPQYVTSSPFTAHAYAQVVCGFLRDCAAAGTGLDPGEPAYIVELGAGSGRFAYHFLRALHALRARGALPGVPLCYVLTDFTPRIVDFWRAHPAFAPLVAAGELDFALFDGEQPAEIELMHSRRVLAPGGVANPLAVIANYFFDSISQDSFTVEGGQLYENLVSLSVTGPVPDLDDPALLGRLELAYALNPAGADYYMEPEFNALLRGYQQRLGNTSFLFPCTALRCIRHFVELSGGRLLLVSGDKGQTGEADLAGVPAPWLELHGSFSMLVNYPALAAYVAALGGQALQPVRQPAHLAVSAFLFGAGAAGYAQTRAAYDEYVAQGGPGEFVVLKREMKQRYEAMTLEQWLAWLRLSGWDAEILLDSVPEMLAKLQTAPAAARPALASALRRVWAGYFPIGEKRDLAFCLGTLAQALTAYADALEYYGYSLQAYGPDASTMHNMDLCRNALQALC